MSVANAPPWAETVLQFWFDEVGEAAWFTRDEQLDARILTRFGELHTHLSADSHEPPLHVVASTARGHLAAIIVLDQFSRNMYRGTPRAFASDAPALALAQRAILKDFDRELTPQQRLFIYMPFEHSELLPMQERSLELIATLGDDNLLDYARRHHEVIARFGRFPHRNAILGRTSTVQELEFLKQHPGF